MRLAAEINRLAIEAVRGSLAVHAGVVAKGGAAVAFPGVSGSGKSTMTAGAVVAGFDYVSDEALCIDYGTKAVLGYPKPLALSDGAFKLLGVPRPKPGIAVAEEDDGDPGEVLVAPHDLGGVARPEPLNLRHVVLRERRPGPSRLTALPASDGMAAMLEHSFNHYRRPAEAFDLAADLARRATTWRLVSDDPREAGRLLLAQLPF